ncbi:MAG: transporter, family, tartrate transporter [Acetobacteraceae bacterium]|jgi:ACS family tartrate transporter-like MFS transporter|nr:transporter, family, tartrate transporter [Acetobacteraceae bacterium]
MGATMDALEQTTMRRVALRLLPYLMLCYFFCFLDRVNVGFAALQMNKDLAFTQTVFGFGAGILFVAYMLCEAPSNLVLVKVGARRWIARIMATWGALACAMAFVTGEYSFYTVRALLGAAEAGFFPGIIFYLTLWFPGTYRARVTGLFMACIPLSAALGAPLSTALLYLDGVAGLRGWQWLFLSEGIPSVILGIVTWFYLTERPAEAHWLSRDARAWLSNRIEIEVRRKEEHLTIGVLATLVNGRVLLLSVIAFSVSAMLFGIGFFLPTIVKGFGLTNMQTGLVSIIPPAAGAAAMILWGRHSDRTMERRWHLTSALTVAAAGAAVAALVDDPVAKMAAFTVSAVGMNSTMPVFWTIAPSFLTGASAAVGIAYINSWAALAAFVAPWMMGFVKDQTGSYTVALLTLAAWVLISAAVALGFSYSTALEHRPEDEALSPV